MVPALLQYSAMTSTIMPILYWVYWYNTDCDVGQLSQPTGTGSPTLDWLAA